MSQPSSQPDEMVQLLAVQTEIEAHIKVAALANQGVEARFIMEGPSWASLLHVRPSDAKAVIWVSRRDLESATRILAQNVSDAPDSECHSESAGADEDEASPRPRRAMPWPARISFVVAVLMVLLGVVAALATIFS
jgi:hypothetical protein